MLWVQVVVHLDSTLQRQCIYTLLMLCDVQGYVVGAGRGMVGQYGTKIAEADKGGQQQDLTDSNYSEFFG